MFIDLTLLFIIYLISVTALGASVYAVWSMVELEAWVKQVMSKGKSKTNAWDHYHNKAKTKPKSTAKGHWD